MSTIIKQSANATIGTAVPVNLGDIAVEAKGIVAQARRQAELIVQKAQAEADAIRQQSREAGRTEGHEAGLGQGRDAGREEARKSFDQQFARVGRALAEGIEQLNERRGRMLAEARQDLVALALATASKIVRQQIAADPQVCQRTVAEAVEMAGRASRLAVRVNPQDLELVQQFARQLVQRLTAEADVQVVADETIERGGCRVRAWHQTGQASEIDATIATQTDRIAAELLGREQGS